MCEYLDKLIYYNYLLLKIFLNNIEECLKHLQLLLLCSQVLKLLGNKQKGHYQRKQKLRMPYANLPHKKEVLMVGTLIWILKISKDCLLMISPPHLQFKWVKTSLIGIQHGLINLMNHGMISQRKNWPKVSSFNSSAIHVDTWKNIELLFYICKICSIFYHFSISI